MKTHVEFRSNAFPPYDWEEDEINPGRFGKRVAEFLARSLKEKGFKLLEPIAEDWGWLIPIKNDEFRLWIGCGNLDGHPDGFLCWIEPHQPTIRPFPFLWRIDTSATVAALQGAIDQVLAANPEIRAIRWWSYEEFTRAGQTTND